MEVSGDILTAILLFFLLRTTQRCVGVYLVTMFAIVNGPKMEINIMFRFSICPILHHYDYVTLYFIK